MTIYPLLYTIDCTLNQREDEKEIIHTMIPLNKDLLYAYKQSFSLLV
jgi:hypothetical protein